jgi:heat shock protein 5
LSCVALFLYVIANFLILLQVSAQDKASGKSQKITITSDKGRLSEDEIERMIKEAEENAETDRVTKENIEAKNHLESYLYSLRNTVQDTLKNKIPEVDKETLLKAVTEALSWLEKNVSETKAVFEEKRKEIETVANPILSNAYNDTKPDDNSGGDGGGNNYNDSKNDRDEEPTVEEVD